MHLPEWFVAHLSLLDKKGVSLTLSLSTLSPPLPCLEGREEGESCSLPEAARSSLNNFSRLPAVLSPVLHHSITPLHKDVQMGWDAHSHMTLTDTLKQARARAHADPHAFATHSLRTARACPHAHERIDAHQHAHVLIKQRWLFGGLPLFFFSRRTFSPSCFFLAGGKVCVVFIPVSVLPLLTAALSCLFPLTVRPQAVNENTAQIALPVGFCSAENSSETHNDSHPAQQKNNDGSGSQQWRI